MALSTTIATFLTIRRTNASFVVSTAIFASPSFCVPGSRCSLFHIFLFCLSAFTSSSSGFFSSFRCKFAVSPLLPMSIARESVSFFSCNSFFLTASSLIPRTNLSRISKSFKQLQKLHVWASFLLPLHTDNAFIFLLISPIKYKPFVCFVRFSNTELFEFLHDFAQDLSVCLRLKISKN